MQNILSAWVEPPSELFADRGRNPPAFRQPSAAFNIDYFAMEAHNRSLGCEGEKFVVRFEQERLAHAGKDNLAARVEHYSLTHGDGAGFDVLSFETTGQERFIEVKTTAYGPWTPFFVTRNEVEASKRNAPGYYLYRNFNFRRQPKLFWKNGPLDRSFRLDPAEYQASLT